MREASRYVRQEISQTVRVRAKNPFDLIKICASGGVRSQGDQSGTPQYTLEEMTAIAEQAHKLGRRVAAHAHGTQSIKDAIRAGIDSIAHNSLIDDEGIALAKESTPACTPRRQHLERNESATWN